MIYGVDIGGSKIEIAVFDRELAMQDRWRTQTPNSDYSQFLNAVVGLVEQADARFGDGEAVGLGIPGLIDADGKSLCANVPCATGQAVAMDLGARLRRPVVADNDCRLFALSEATGGAGEGYHRVFGAILGTGAAAGLVIDGVLEHGRQGIVGEYGHIQLPASIAAKRDLPIWRCGCGLPACVESYISGPGLVALARHFGLDRTTVPTIMQAYRADEPCAIETFECYMDILGATFATVSMMVDPDLVVLGGGLSLVDEVVDGLPAAISGHLFKGFAPPPVVRPRFGDSSGVRGAAIEARSLFS